MQESQVVNTPQTQPTSIPEMTVDISKLPSRGLGYPDGHKFYYRTYTFGEIKQASVTNDMDLSQIIDTVMSGIRSDGFNKMKMSFIDMLYIGLMRRVSSQSHLKFEMPYLCEGCNKHSKAIFGSDDIDFQEIKEEVTSLPIEVDLGGHTFQFMYPTVQNMLDVKIKQDSKKKRKGIPAMDITAASVVNMTLDQAREKLSALTDPEDMETLADIDSLLFHDIKPIKAVCKNKVENDDGNEVVCGTENEVSIEGKELLIKPFRDSGTPNRNKIRFINQPVS